MGLLPKVTRCPCCNALNFIRLNGIEYDNPFRSFASWKIKRRFNCRKCHEELGLFTNSSNIEKIFWLNMIKCEELYSDRLNILNERKAKLSKIGNQKYYDTLKDIDDIQNQIRLDKIKLKIKFKISKKGILNRHVN